MAFCFTPFNEGMSSKNVVYRRALTSKSSGRRMKLQQGRRREKFYLLGSNYVSLANSSSAGTSRKGHRTVAEEYTELGHLEYRQVIRTSEGRSGCDLQHYQRQQRQLYNELAAAGITADRFRWSLASARMNCGRSVKVRGISRRELLPVSTRPRKGNSSRSSR